MSKLQIYIRQLHMFQFMLIFCFDGNQSNIGLMKLKLVSTFLLYSRDVCDYVSTNKSSADNATRKRAKIAGCEQVLKFFWLEVAIKLYLGLRNGSRISPSCMLKILKDTCGI